MSAATGCGTRAVSGGCTSRLKFKGKGWEGALIREAISRASNMTGLEQISLGVISGNDSARNLYLSLGFESYGFEKRAIVINEEYHDDELMQMFLNHKGQANQT